MAPMCLAMFICFDMTGKPKVEFEELPSLPVPLAFLAGAVLGNRLYMAGGQESKKVPVATNHFFRWI
jgi:hypothetical protein